ncbi:hypothetical protein R6Q57_011218 [Mikania cordata]
MADVAGYHGGDGGDEPPHRHSYRVPTSCKSFKFLNGSRPLPIEFDYSSNLYRAVGENCQLFIRLISNEVDRHAPFHYPSWQEVPGDVKMSILTILHHYFDLTQYHNIEYWDGIKLVIQADCANRYKDRKTKLKKHFDKEGGYDNTTRAKQNLPKDMDPEEWVQENITDELNKSKSTSGGDDTPVDEVEVLQRSLGQRRGQVRGVGRKVKSITPDLPPHMYAPATNELQQQLAKTNARWAEQQRINEMMQQRINEMMQQRDDATTNQQIDVNARRPRLLLFLPSRI